MPNVTITLDENTLLRARRHAEKECRSLSQQVAFLIQKDEESRSAFPDTIRVSAANSTAARRSTPRKQRRAA